MCRSRRELSNAYFIAKFGFDTAENEPCKAAVSLLSGHLPGVHHRASLMWTQDLRGGVHEHGRADHAVHLGPGLQPAHEPAGAFFSPSTRLGSAWQKNLSTLLFLRTGLVIRLVQA